MLDTRETIMAHARTTAQARGYNGLSFRELAKAVGVKSASVHYHFPTKGDLGAALARRYREDAEADLERIRTGSRDPAACLRSFTGLYRLALENDNRMCLCSQLAAEYDDLPDVVKVEVKAFGDMNIAWLAKVLADAIPADDEADIKQRALAIFAAVGGAQLTARSRGDIGLYDGIIEGYRAAGLIPG